MVIALLVVEFVVAFGVATIVVLVFSRPIHGILNQLIPGEMSRAWARYLKFAMYIMGIAGGVRIWDMEKYLVAQEPYRQIVQLTPERWVLEVYQTIIGTLQATAMLLLIFFVFALIALVIVRAFEMWRTKGEPQSQADRSFPASVGSSVTSSENERSPTQWRSS